MAINIRPTALPLDSIFVPNSMRVDEDLFEELVLALKEALGPSSGLTSDDIDVTFLGRLMKLYDARDSNWAKYALGDSSRGYTRNLVDEGNGKSNLVRPPHLHPVHSIIVTWVNKSFCLPLTKYS